MDLTHPESSLINRTDAAVLGVLARSDQGLTGRRIAALAELPPSTVAESLNRLVTIGLVHFQHVGRAFLHTANRDHVVWPTVEAALVTRQRLLDRYRALMTKRPEATLVLYGSVARGDANADSDVDLLLVLADDAHAESLAGELSTMTLAWTGHHAQVYDVTVSQLFRLVRKGSSIVDSWLTDGITLSGRPLTEIVREAAA